jgi:hypothetical protein
MSCLLRLMSGEVGRELASRKQLLAVVERTGDVPKQKGIMYKYLMKQKNNADYRHFTEIVTLSLSIIGYENLELTAS